MDVKSSKYNSNAVRNNLVTDKKDRKIKRKEYEDKIASYNGNDPLEPRYDLIRWMEDNYPNSGLDDGIIPLMAETLSLLKDDVKYKQDNRYIGLLIKYTQTQPNPLGIFDTIYKQGRGTECAILYHAWASQCMKENNFQLANDVYQLGLKNKAEPFDALQEVQRLFQLNFGRRMLGVTEEAPNTPCRKALNRLQIYSQFQRPSNAKDEKENKKLTEQNSDKENPTPVAKQMGCIPKTNVNSAIYKYEKDNPSRRIIYPKECTVEVNELQFEELKAQNDKYNKPKVGDKCINNQTRQKSAFYCPVAFFEPDDPKKVVMYPKDKIYVIEEKIFVPELNLFEIKGKELQLEELKAMEYERRYRNKISNSMSSDQSSTVKTPNNGTSQEMQLSSEKTLQDSVLNNQSYTVATREAMNLVRKMWTSPTPVSVLKSGLKSVSRGKFVKDTFKSPPLPATKFNLYVDESSSNGQQLGHALVDAKNAFGARRQIEGGLPATLNNQDSDELACALPSTKRSEVDGAVHMEGVVSRQPFAIYASETDSVETCVSVKQSEISIMSSGTPSKIEMIATTTTSTRKTQFIVKVDECALVNRHEMPESENAIAKNLLSQIHPTDSATALCSRQIDLINDQIDKENNPQLPCLKRPFEKRSLAQLEQHDEEANETCITKAFALSLPSSTPYSNQLKTPRNCDNDNTEIYSCYVAPEQEAPKAAELSIIQEASNERYSSSSGSSSSGQTPACGTVNSLKIVNTHSELKEERVGEIEKSVSKLDISGDIDPFCPNLLETLLAKVNFPRSHHKTGYKVINRDAPIIREKSTVAFGIEKYILDRELGKGAYARVLKASHKDKWVALKHQKPAFPWEYYIACEIRKRLDKSPLITGLFMEIRRCYIFNNGSVLETELGKYGSLLNVMNTIKKSTNRPMNPTLATLFSAHIFKIVEHLHKCQIIHGDIKPDNFVLCALPTSDISQLSLKLIDFGRSIDMSLLPENTTFTTIVKTDGFQCNEMKEQRPWTYQTDFYGLAGTVHCLLVGDYMKVVKRANKWVLQRALPRYFNKELWQPIFNGLLNVESCSSLPDIIQMRRSLEIYLDSLGRVVYDQMSSISNIINGY